MWHSEWGEGGGFMKYSWLKIWEGLVLMIVLTLDNWPADG